MGAWPRRFWLDAATKLPLRREIFDSHARMISEDAFIDLDLGPASGSGMPAAGARPWTGQLDSAGLAALRAQGWPLPASLPGQLTLFAASQTSTQSGKVVDLSYSDGLSVVSLFLQRGRAAAADARLASHGDRRGRPSSPLIRMSDAWPGRQAASSTP